MQIFLIGIQFSPKIVRVVCVGGLGNFMGVSEFLGGFYKLISWDFGVVFEQIAVQNEEA